MSDSQSQSPDYPGLIIVWTIICITVGLFVISKPNLAFASPNNLLLTASQLFALIGTVLLSFAYLLSSRLNFLETWFGSLDKVYRLHHLLGTAAFTLLINHPLLMAIDALPNSNISLIYLLPQISFPDYLFGQLALYTLIVLITLTLYVRLSYQAWKATHEYMGLVVLLAFLHILLIDSDVSRYLPLKVWILAISASGLLASVYRRFLYDKFGPVHHYLVSSIHRTGQVWELLLSPQSSPITHHPGQFVFLKFPNSPEFKESHPFSISSPPGSSQLRLSIKSLGDYTDKLDKLHSNSPAAIYGPYGQFFLKFASCDTAICIAGGIGITPFISLLESGIRPGKKPTFLYYAVKSLSEAYYHPQLQKLSATANYTYRLRNTEKTGRITIAQIIKDSGVDPKAATYFICGPLSMMTSMRDQLLDLGVRNSHIIIEDFDLK